MLAAHPAALLTPPPPTSVTVHASLAHGASRHVTVRSPSFGELVFNLKVSSDNNKHVVVKVRRVGAAHAITVFNVGSTKKNAGCQGAAGSLFCGPVQVPAPHPSKWVITITNPGAAASIRLKERFHHLSGAG